MDEDALFFIKANCGAIAYPSTEQAYVEQRQNECFERFGLEIDTSKIDDSNMDGGRIVFDKNKDAPFLYRKDTDTLYACGVPLYQAGKWAQKVKERVEVQWLSHSNEVFGFQASRKITKAEIEGATKLIEKYLNGEIK